MGRCHQTRSRVRSPGQRGEVDVELGREIATMLLLRIRAARGNATALCVALGMATAAVSLFEAKKVHPDMEQTSPTDQVSTSLPVTD